MTKCRLLHAFAELIFLVFLHLSFSICDSEKDKLQKDKRETVKTFCIIDAINTNLFHLFVLVSAVSHLSFSTACQSVLFRLYFNNLTTLMEMTCARNTAKKY